MKKISLTVFAIALNLAMLVSITVVAEKLTLGLKEQVKKKASAYIADKYNQFTFDDDLRIDDPVIKAYQDLYDVQKYSLKFSFDIPKKLIIGNVEMNSINTSDTLKKVYVNLQANMKVNYVKLNDEEINFARENDYIVINTSGRINKFENFKITIDYSGTPENKGFDSFAFKLFDNAPAIYTLSEPTYAPTWWACKDIVSDKSMVDIFATVPSSLTVGSNGLLEEVKDISDSTKEFHWSSKYPISSYLVSLAIGKYDKWTDTYTSLDGSKTMPVEYYAYPSFTQRAKTDWSRTPEMIKLFSEKFGEYPFIDEKYGMAMFGWVSGAMEHQTLSSMGYTLITGNKEYEEVTAHELVHQWYGDAVSPESWKDIWLNEGFASYGEALWEEHLGGQEALQEYMKQEDYGYFNGTVYNPEGFIFGPTVYEKGGWCLHMLRGVTGDSLFFDILHQYYEKYKFKNANTYQFKDVCESVSGMDLGYFFDQWVFTGTGRPEYELSWKADEFDGQSGSGAYMLRINLEQRQKDRDIYKMPVTFTVITDKGEQKIKFFNDKKKQQFEQPVNGNVKEVILDEEGWMLKSVKKVKYKEKY